MRLISAFAIKLNNFVKMEDVMMTLSSVLWIAGIFVVFVYMMKNGGGCCGGHDQKKEEKSKKKSSCCG